MEDDFSSKLTICIWCGAAEPVIMQKPYTTAPLEDAFSVSREVESVPLMTWTVVQGFVVFRCVIA